MNYKNALLTSPSRTYPIIFRNTDLLQYIMKFLNLSDLAHFRRVSKYFRGKISPYFNHIKVKYLQDTKICISTMYKLTANPLYKSVTMEKLNPQFPLQIIESGNVPLFKFVKNRYPDFVEIVMHNEFWKQMSVDALESLFPEILTLPARLSHCRGCLSIHDVAPKNVILSTIHVQLLDKYFQHYDYFDILKTAIVYYRNDLFFYALNKPKIGYDSMIRNLSIRVGFIPGLEYLYQKNLLPTEIWNEKNLITSLFLSDHGYRLIKGKYIKTQI